MVKIRKLIGSYKMLLFYNKKLEKIKNFAYNVVFEFDENKINRKS